jgi:capsular polysaccharide biosynthesis protein
MVGIIVGLAGSGLHNALFSPPGSRLASIGFINFVQSEIAGLRGQNIAFLTREVNLAGDFTVNEAVFEAFLARVCA